MNYDGIYIERRLGAIDPATQTLVTQIAETLGPLLSKLGITNDNGIIAARDKIAQYVTQVTGDRAEAYAQLYNGFNLAHSDINNVGTTAYYTKVLARLNAAVLNYIANHAWESSDIFKTEINADEVLKRYEQNVKNGMKLDHAFWMAFTGKKDPYDIRTGSALPVTGSQSGSGVTIDTSVLKDIRDAAGNLLQPGTPEYTQAVKAQTDSGNFTQTALLMGVGVAVLAGIAYVATKNKKES